MTTVRRATPPIAHLLLVSAFASCLVAPPRAAARADEDLAAMVERRVRDWRPTRNERMLDQIGWASDLVEAWRLARERRRPLFVFTYDGSTTRANAIALQRC